jgi:DNA polymerase I-like protein with 3'-5' exonuclease and polymerase domains
MTWACVDLETTINSSYKRKANPFDSRNWVVMAGWCSKTDPFPACLRYTQSAQYHDWFIELISPASGNTLIVGANIKFDLLHLLKDNATLDAWMAYVARGGNIWDIQLAEYLLDGQAQSSHMLSLDDMAVRYGCDTKVDEVKLLWEAGVPTEEIDPALLTRYLIGEDLVDPLTGEPTGRRREGDIGNTRDIFLQQVAKAKASGQSRSILMNMGALIATVEMERNGMYIDQPLGFKLAEELRERLKDASEGLNQYLPPNLPFQFKWTNRYHLSPLVFGGDVKYDGYEYDLKDGTTTLLPPELCDPAYAYAQKDELHYAMEDGTTLSPADYDEQLRFAGSKLPQARAQFKGGKNAGEYKTKKVKVDDFTKPKGRGVKVPFNFKGYTEPNQAWASSTPGLYSVAAEVIEELGSRKGIPFLEALTSVIGMTKDLGTYFITTDEETGESKGMLTLVQPDSIIHHMLNHTSTVTGRFSSSNPNLQNIPKGNKSDVKQVFISRFADGVILQSDFSSLEVYVQAILTACRLLIEDLQKGTDLHCMRLAMKEHREYDEVLKLCKGYTDALGVYIPAVDEWDYKRTGAKVFSFQRAYGAGAAKIASSTGMPLEEVEALTAAEQARWPEIDEYFAERTIEIKKNRKPTATMVPHPDNPAIMCQLGISRVSTPDGKLYTYRESPSPKYLLSRGSITSFSPTEIKNYEVQGTGGEWMKAALWLMVRAWYARSNYAGRSLLVNTVHDAAYTDTAPDMRDHSAALMAACMEAASDFMEYWFNWKLPLPVPTDTVWGANMGEENKFTGPEYKALVSELRTALRRDYMNGYTPSYLGK